MVEKRRRLRRGSFSALRMIALGFAGIILLGSLLLSLPCAAQNGESIGWFDALFTSTSAVCVTGLVVVDTGTTFNLFGKIVLLCLIQVGGLGFMTFATLLFRLITAPQVVPAHKFADISAPHRAVERCNHPDIKGGGFFQHSLYLLAIFSHDVGIISSGFIVPAFINQLFIVEDFAVHCTESAKGISRKQCAGCGFIAHNNFRPVHHRCCYKMQCMPAKAKAVAVFYCDDAVAQIHIEKLADHPACLCRCDHFHFREHFDKAADVGTVVRLHMMNNKIIQISAIQQMGQIFKKGVRNKAVYCVCQCCFFIINEIRIV